MPEQNPDTDKIDQNPDTDKIERNSDADNVEQYPDADKLNKDRMELAVPEMDGAALTNVLHTDIGFSSPFMREIYLRKQPIVGTRFQGGSDELVEDLEVGSRISFLREPDNAFDPDAVMALDEQGRKLGYIPRRENELIGALMEAGKYFYGIITEKPRENPFNHSRTPGSIWMDLYMKEFALPDDLSEIPLQGYRGSYAILDLQIGSEDKNSVCKNAVSIRNEKANETVYETGSRCMSLFVIKVIHGEEKNTFSRTYIPELENDDDYENNELISPFAYMDRLDVVRDYEEFISGLDHFIGHLPVVGHGLCEEKSAVLQDAYGMVLGKTFSNHIIDTRQMAENHLPDAGDYSLGSLADLLGIDIRCQDPGEERCRIIWQLYRRMDRSEL